MTTRKKDGTFNCALCDKPRKHPEIYTLCSGHMEVYYNLAEETRCDSEKWTEYNKLIGDNLE